MLKFREIQLNDKEWIERCLRVSDFRGCEYTFANNLAWRRLSDTVVCNHEDFYISCSYDKNRKPVFTFPAGAKCDSDGIAKYKALFCELKDYAESVGAKLKISSVNSEHLAWMQEFYKDEITISPNRDSFDYIYRSEDLIELKGKKYHGKRNHIKRFKENNWSFEEITPQCFDECTTLAAEFYNNKNYDDYSAAVEQFVIHTFFSNFDYLGLKGGVLRKDGKIVGFTIGEQVNSDTFVVHIEKAKSEIQGAYPVICNEFAKEFASDIKYINREEDMGIEGLRKSKLSYHPDFLLEKSTVTFK